MPTVCLLDQSWHAENSRLLIAAPSALDEQGYISTNKYLQQFISWFMIEFFLVGHDLDNPIFHNSNLLNSIASSWSWVHHKQFNQFVLNFSNGFPTHINASLALRVLISSSANTWINSACRRHCHRWLSALIRGQFAGSRYLFFFRAFWEQRISNWQRSFGNHCAGSPHIIDFVSSVSSHLRYC